MKTSKEASDMDRIAPLFLLLMVYFVIGSLSKSAKKLKKQQTGSARQARKSSPALPGVAYRRAAI